MAEQSERTGSGGGSSESLSRRGVLRASGALVGAGALAGCSEDDVERAGDTLEETRTALMDPESVEWWVHREMDADELAARNDRAEDNGLVMVDIGFDEATAGYYAIWHENVWHEDLPGERDWQAHWDLPSDEFAETWEQLGDDGYRLLTQTHYVTDGERNYAGVWIENEHDLDWKSHRNSTEQEFLDRYDDYEDDLLPIDFEAYEAGDGDDAETWYASVWVENVDDLAWELEYDLSPDEYVAALDGWIDGPERLVDLVTYRDGGQQRYAAIAVENTERNAFQGRQARASPSSSRGWMGTRHSSATTYRNAFGELTDRGYRPISLSIDGTAPEMSHAVVWRQNAHRLSDPMTDELDEVLAEHVVEEYTDDGYEPTVEDPLPNVSAVVVEDGEVVYQRGFGYGDVDDGRWVDSHTTYRLASVSKTIGGILGLVFENKGVLDLDDEIHEHVDGVDEDDHDYTLEQLLRHQACIPHYAESDVSSREYDTYDSAHEAAEEFGFWTDELLVDVVAEPEEEESGGEDSEGADEEEDGADEPGEVEEDDIHPLEAGDTCSPGDAYRYSTAGFTLLGAAYEGANGGTPIADLVREELGEPFGLDSLRAEDRTASGLTDTETGRLRRARAYEWDEDAEANVLRPESDVDDISWKVLGGGLEASASDLARLGQLVLEADGRLVDQSAQDDLWDSSIESYGLGWRVGQAIAGGDFHEVRYHGGDQLGGNSSIMVYPDDDVVVAVLSSRKKVTDDDWNDDDDAGVVARALADTVLG